MPKPISSPNVGIVYRANTDQERKLATEPGATLPVTGWQAKAPARATAVDATNTVESNARKELAELNAHGKQVGYPFAVIAGTRDALLQSGPDVEVKNSTGAVVKRFSVKELQAQGNPVVPWTVNTKADMLKLMESGVNGLISDYPDVLRQAVEEYSAKHGGAYLDKNGLIDDTKFSAQAHRGGCGLRPENTLPSMEVGLDNLASTLETDVAITSDGVPVLSHENTVFAGNGRRADGKPYGPNEQVHVKDVSLKELQSTFIMDKTTAGRPQQRNDRSLSPVAVAFSKAQGMADPYVMPTVDQLFAFTKFYADYYKNGEGKTHPDAERRWRNAERVHFDIETKVSPHTEQLGQTIAVGPFTHALGDAIMRNGMQGRAEIQSFDKRSIAIVQKDYPALQTVFLMKD